MPVLHLSLLGPLVATLDNQPFSNFKTNKVLALLIFTAVEKDQKHPREALMTLLWPDMPLESAQVNLRQTLYRLRQAIPELSQKEKAGNVPLLITDRQFVQLNPDADIRVDLDELEILLERDPVQAITLYRGDFLANFFLADSNQFEGWAQQNRENLRRKILVALDELTLACFARDDYEMAQNYAWRQIEIDSLRESAYRQLMISFSKTGQRNAALSQYQICQKRLEKELGVAPSPETSALYNQIQAEALSQKYSRDEKSRKRDTDCMPIFLLTDIEGSTRLWDTHHQAMLSALMQHNAILETQIVRYGGRILELRGDGVKAVFEGGDPLTGMLEIQKELGSANWGEIGEMKIRIGLHGVPVVRKGYDFFLEDDQYYGPVLNHTARIMDTGWGGQILVSEQVRNTCPLPHGASWQDFGSHKVKSLDQSIKIYGLLHPDLPHQSFPPLRTLSNQRKIRPDAVAKNPPHNLPHQVTPFIGRQKELDDLFGLLSQPQNQLVSIVGPGGMGKTRLALALAEGLIHRCTNGQKDCFYQDGVYFVPLATLDEPGEITRTIAMALNVPLDAGQKSEILEQTPQAETTPEESLFSFLENKQTLIILDNFEHLVEGAELVSNLLQASPHLQIIVTSRERLQLQEEQIYPIQGLEFPDWEAPQDPCDYTAMELFLQSAQRVQPNFEFKTTDMIYLTRICNLVGGMPLGLELAASWIDMLSVRDIAEEIQKSIDFLETDLRNIPDRHRSMRAVFDSSWNRLNSDEQRIFSRFSLLRGSFSRDAAQEIAGASIRNLASFVSKSLLHYNQGTDSYQVHELLRQYGEERLQQNPDEAFKTQEQHSAYYCNAVHRHMDTLMAGNSHLSFEQIGAEIDNIRRAWSWAIQNKRFTSLNQAINGLCLYYASDWGLDNGLKICNQAVDLLSGIKARPVDSDEDNLRQLLYVKALSWSAFYSFTYSPQKAQGQFEQSKQYVNKLLEAGVDARTEKALLFYFIGITNMNTGELERAQTHTEECLALSKETDFDWMVLNALDLMGDIANALGSPREARYWYEKSLVEARAKNIPSGEIRALQSMGWAARHLMSYDEARNYYNQGIQLARNYENPTEEIYAIQQLGFLCVLLGEYEEAIQHFKKAISISEPLGVPQRTLPSRVHIGFSHWMLAEFDQAEKTFLTTLNQLNNMADASKIFPLACYAEFLIINGQYREACAQLKIVETISKQIFAGYFSDGRVTRNLGWIALVEKNYSEAKVQFERSIQLYATNTDDEQVAWSQAGLARAEIGLGNRDEAKSVLMEALWTSIEMQAFIPLVFTLPVTLLFLAGEDCEKAKFIASQIRAYPLLRNAKLFHDTINRYLPDEVNIVDPFKLEPKTDPRPYLWRTAAKIMFEWTQIWMEESETIKPDGN